MHRGITAEHVTVTHDGHVKLGGFGLAKPAADVHLTQVGAALGNVRYMSPEQVTGVDTLDGRADLYAVGVLLFYTLTGKLPFDGANDFEIMVAQVSVPPPHPRQLNAAIAPELEQIVLTALSKQREARFRDAKEFREALAALQAPAGSATSPPQPLNPVPERALPQFLADKTGDDALYGTLHMVGLLCLAVALIVLLFVAVH